MTPAQISEIRNKLNAKNNNNLSFSKRFEIECSIIDNDVPALLAHISELSTENKKLIETGERLTIENKQLIEKMEQLESALQLRWVPISNPPDNGQIVLCGNRNWQLSVPIVAQYSDDELEEESFFADIDGDHVQPTHWMRIANLPSTKEETENERT